MNRKMVFVIFSAVIAAALSGWVSRGLAQGEKTANLTTLKVIEHADTDIVLDLGESGDTSGDILTFANPVFNENDAEQVGTDNGYCVRIVVGESWYCHFQLFLSDGDMTVDGVFLDSGTSTLDIIGGSGAYFGAQGNMLLDALNPEGTQYSFVYQIYFEANQTE